MAGPAIVVVAGFVTAYLAVVSSDGLVEDDYYKQGLAVNQRTAREQQGVALGLQAEIMPGDGGTQLRVFLRGKANVSLPPALKLHFAHPTRSGVDQNIDLHAENPGVYYGQLSAPLAGRWHVVLQDNKNDWRLTGDWNIEKQPTLALPAAVPPVADINASSLNRGK
jgi:hypothetical protein